MKKLILLVLISLFTGCSTLGTGLSAGLQGMGKGLQDASRDNSGDVKFCTSQQLGTMTYMNCQ